MLIDSWDRYSNHPRGHWTTILGDVGDRATQSAVILHEHGVITREFGEAVLRCLPPADFQPGPEDYAARVDLRGISVCSIDPPGCKDIDDALSVEPLENGNFSVGVHIADVTHFVHPDTAIDKEASERCTTVYLVEKRTDMLPALLTTDICSLRANVERLTFSVVWEMTPSAEIVGTKFHRSVIKSQAALSYAEAQARIDDTKDQSELTKRIRVTRPLEDHKEQADGRRRPRARLPGGEVRARQRDAGSHGRGRVHAAGHEQAHRGVHAVANQAVATKILTDFPMFGVLRRHPAPKDEALKVLAKLLASNGIPDFKFGSNKELGDSLDSATKAEDPYFNTLVRIMATRCMNQAVYFCTGELDPSLYSHYGLAMERYTHFTSPIRRYADVLVHRLLAASLGLAPLPESLQSKTAISEQCDVINLKHRNAQWASRASSDLHTFMFFKKKGETLARAVVIRVRKSGMQVSIARYGIEGVVVLPEADWDLDEDAQTARKKSDASVRIAVFDRIEVKVAADDSNFRNRTLITFERVIPVGEGQAFDQAEQEKRREVQKEMYPDRLIQEAN